MASTVPVLICDFKSQRTEKLKRTCAETDVHAEAEVLGERVLVVVQEELIITQRTHRDTNLTQVVQVLQGGILAQQDTVVDLVRAEVGGHQVIHIACLATVGAELERAEATAGAELIEHTEVGVGVVHPVRVRGVVGGGPVVR